MLTRLTIKNFKCFENVEIELGNPVVFIGPNNSGKTTALQALALWDIGVKRWIEKFDGKAAPARHRGVAINRHDLIALPVPDANLLWHNLHLRNGKRGDVAKAKAKGTQNVTIEIGVEGIAAGKEWRCVFEFEYANAESFYCRPVRATNDQNSEAIEVPTVAVETNVAFLPPMSGLASNEKRLDTAKINARLGEGRTAEVLRNLCYQIAVLNGKNSEPWQRLVSRIKDLFGITLDEPHHALKRGEIIMTYRNSSGVRLDLSSSGRGLQQTLLLLAYLSVYKESVLLLDEPDTHLEILRQRQIYHVLTEAAREQGSQIVAASHSEVILNEAAGRDVVVSFVGKPHRIDDRGGQLLRSLKEIGFEHYYQAEQKGWVLYLERSSDLAVLRSFAAQLGHPSQKELERPYVRYILNQPQDARIHFRGLREAKPDLSAYTLCGRLASALKSTPKHTEHMWARRGIENYHCQPKTLLKYAASMAMEAGPLFEESESQRLKKAMQECIDDYVPRAASRDMADRWWEETKVCEDFLDRLFPAYFKKFNLPNLMNKTNYHVLARHVDAADIAPEVKDVLDGILAAAQRATPAAEALP